MLLLLRERCELELNVDDILRIIELMFDCLVYCCCNVEGEELRGEAICNDSVYVIVLS